MKPPKLLRDVAAGLVVDPSLDRPSDPFHFPGGRELRDRSRATTQAIAFDRAHSPLWADSPGWHGADPRRCPVCNPGRVWTDDPPLPVASSPLTLLPPLPRRDGPRLRVGPLSRRLPDPAA